VSAIPRPPGDPLCSDIWIRGGAGGVCHSPAEMSEHIEGQGIDLDGPVLYLRPFAVFPEKFRHKGILWKFVNDRLEWRPFGFWFFKVALPVRRLEFRPDLDMGA
jgi:hypothetical protein